MKLRIYFYGHDCVEINTEMSYVQIMWIHASVASCCVPAQFISIHSMPIISQLRKMATYGVFVIWMERLTSSGHQVKL